MVKSTLDLSTRLVSSMSFHGHTLFTYILVLMRGFEPLIFRISAECLHQLGHIRNETLEAQVGIEPTTYALTAHRSSTELLSQNWWRVRELHPRSLAYETRLNTDSTRYNLNIICSFIVTIYAKNNINFFSINFFSEGTKRFFNSRIRTSTIFTNQEFFHFSNLSF